MRMFVLCLVALGLGWCALAVESGDGLERLSGEKRRKFVDPKDDLVFQALTALTDDKLEGDIVAAMDAFFSSRFTEAHIRVAAILQEYPESSIGDTLYDFLLLMNGTALGFSGECEQAIETLDVLIARLGEKDDAEAVDNLAGVMDLKRDISNYCHSRHTVRHGMVRNQELPER